METNGGRVRKPVVNAGPQQECNAKHNGCDDAKPKVKLNARSMGTDNNSIMKSEVDGGG